MRKKIIFGIAFLILGFLVFLYFLQELRLKDYLEKECHFENCVVDLKGLVHEKPDYIFIFYPEISKNEISKAIGFEYHNDAKISDERRRIIIVKNKKVIFEDEFWNNEIEFQNGETIKFSKGKILNNPYDFFKNSKFNVQYLKEDNFYLMKMN